MRGWSSRAGRICAIAAMVALGACEYLPFKLGSSDLELLARPWAKPQTVVIVPPVYCYSTVADRDCYAEPQPHWAGRQVGSLGRVTQ